MSKPNNIEEILTKLDEFDIEGEIIENHNVYCLPEDNCDCLNKYSKIKDWLKQELTRLVHNHEILVNTIIETKNKEITNLEKKIIDEIEEHGYVEYLRNHI